MAAPTDISGLQGWWKADVDTYTSSSLTTAATTDGTAVGGWKDQSGNGKHLTQPDDDTRRPLLKLNIVGTLPALKFDGSNDVLYSGNTLTFASGNDKAFTFFLIMQKVSSSGVDAVMEWANSAGNNAQHYVGDNNGVWRSTRRADSGVTDTQTGGSLSNATAYYVVLSFTGTTVTLRVNGANSINGNSQDTTTVTIDRLAIGSILSTSNGTGSPADAYVIEAGVYDTAISGANLTTLETYLSERINPPTGQPTGRRSSLCQGFSVNPIGAEGLKVA